MGRPVEELVRVEYSGQVWFVTRLITTGETRVEEKNEERLAKRLGKDCKRTDGWGGP